MSNQQKEDLPGPPPDYPRSYRKAITEGKYSGRIQCKLCKMAIPPEKIDRHENGESKLHNRNLAERYAKEQQRNRERERKRQRKLEQEEQERREREQKRQREEELERERGRQRQIEAERKRDVEALGKEPGLQNSSDEAIEISSTSSSSSSSSSDYGSDAKVSSDDDSDVQIVLPPSKTPNNTPNLIEKPKGISQRKYDGMWQSQISVVGRNRHIGNFRTAEAAAAAYQAVRKALDESGLPPKDNGRIALFESVRAKVKGEAANTTDASATSTPASPSTPVRTAGVTCTNSPSKNTPKGTMVPPDRHYTGDPSTIRCMETTKRGKPCLFCAVPGLRFCNLHSSGLSGSKHKRKRGPAADDRVNSNSPGSSFDTESPRQRKKARRSESKSDLQEVAANNLGLTLPKKPKGAIGSFIYYRMDMAAEIAASNTSASSTEVSRIIGEKWHSLSSEEKARYDTMANKSKKEYEQAYERYKVEFDEFKKAHPEWQVECDRIVKEHTAEALKELDQHIASKKLPPSGPSLGGSAPIAPIPKISATSSSCSNELILGGLKNGSIRLEPKYEIILENIELVMATREDEERKKSTSIYRRGNIGLHCVHCKHLPRSQQKKQALVFPRDVSCFGGNFSNFRTHFRLCQNVGSELRAQIESPRDYSPPPNQYVSVLPYCRAVGEGLGIEDDPNGTVRFSIDVPRGEEPTSFLIKPNCISTNPSVSAHRSVPLHTQDNWQRHHASEQVPSLKCNYCNKSFTTSNGLKYHLDHAVCQKSSEDTANTNDSILDSEQAIQGAIDTDAASSDSSLACNHCKKSFTTSNGLKYHLDHAVCQKSSQGVANADVEILPTTGEGALERAIRIADAEPSPLIFPTERQNDTTDLIYLVVNHFAICNLTRAEQNTGARSHLPIGLAGLQCKHCSKTFYSGSSKDFSYRFNERIFGHLQACTVLPSGIGSALSFAKAACKLQMAQRYLDPEQHTAFKMKVHERLMSHSSHDGDIEPFHRSLPTHRLMKSPASSNISSGKVGISSSSAFWAEVDDADERKEADALFPCSQRRTTTDFNYLVIRQFSLCHRSSQEQRSRYPIGYPGICCVHCQSRMYFPDSTSFMKQFSQKVYDHLRRCPRATPSLSVALAQALQRRDDQKQALGEQGSLTSFCDRVLGKMLRDAKAMPLGQAPPSTNSRSKKSQGRRAQTSQSHEDNSDEPFVDAPVLLEMDKTIATAHHFDLLSQFGIGELTERAQVANPSLAKFPIGQPGLRCRHCKSKTFYYERLANMKSRCVGQLRDHIRKSCHSVPEDIRQRFASDYDHSAMQRQLSNVEGGNLDRMFQRLWLRLYHDFSRRKEIDAIARVTPLLEDYESDDSLFTGSSDDDDDGGDDNDDDKDDGEVSGGGEKGVPVGEKETFV